MHVDSKWQYILNHYNRLITGTLRQIKLQNVFLSLVAGVVAMGIKDTNVRNNFYHDVFLGSILS